MLLRSFRTFATVAILACTAGRSDGGSSADPFSGTAPSCEELSEQYAACNSNAAKDKQRFVAVCTQQPRFTAACRRCLDGKVCGDTQACDASCGK